MGGLFFLTHFWKLQDIPRFQDVCASMWEFTNLDLFYVKHCMFFVVSSMAKYVHLQITLVSRCVMKKKIQEMYEFLKSTLVWEYITKFNKLCDYRFFSSLNIANFPKKISKFVKNLKIGRKRGQKCKFWGTHLGKYLW